MASQGRKKSEISKKKTNTNGECVCLRAGQQSQAVSSFAPLVQSPLGCQHFNAVNPHNERTSGTAGLGFLRFNIILNEDRIYYILKVFVSLPIDQWRQHHPSTQCIFSLLTSAAERREILGLLAAIETRLRSWHVRLCFRVVIPASRQIMAASCERCLQLRSAAAPSIATLAPPAPLPRRIWNCISLHREVLIGPAVGDVTAGAYGHAPHCTFFWVQCHSTHYSVFFLPFFNF